MAEQDDPGDWVKHVQETAAAAGEKESQGVGRPRRYTIREEEEMRLVPGEKADLERLMQQFQEGKLGFYDLAQAIEDRYKAWERLRHITARIDERSTVDEIVVIMSKAECGEALQAFSERRTKLEISMEQAIREKNGPWQASLFAPLAMIRQLIEVWQAYAKQPVQRLAAKAQETVRRREEEARRKAEEGK
jgi:superfamily II RNA helicase